MATDGLLLDGDKWISKKVFANAWGVQKSSRGHALIGFSLGVPWRLAAAEAAEARAQDA